MTDENALVTRKELREAIELTVKYTDEVSLLVASALSGKLVDETEYSKAKTKAEEAETKLNDYLKGVSNG